jgi:hypothetical protein
VRNKVDANSRVEGRCMMKTSTKEGKKAKRGWENFSGTQLDSNGTRF